MTVFDEIENVGGRTRTIVLIVGAVLLTLGVVKVRNELKMTTAYDRQALALERMADSIAPMQAVNQKLATRGLCGENKSGDF